MYMNTYLDGWIVCLVRKNDYMMPVTAHVWMYKMYDNIADMAELLSLESLLLYYSWVIVQFGKSDGTTVLSS